MSGKSLLIVAHAPSPNTERLARAVYEGASDTSIATIDVTLLSPFDADAADVIEADALILGTTENIGYMSGALKDFFDRSYYGCLDHTDAKPYAAFIRAGLDGTGTKRAIESICSGLRWKPVQAPMICHGAWNEDFVTQCRELGMAMAAGLEGGMF
ncbi:MAG: flavodoxin family protein [Pseudomonadota bacterium]